MPFIGYPHCQKVRKTNNLKRHGNRIVKNGKGKLWVGEIDLRFNRLLYLGTVNVRRRYTSTYVYSKPIHWQYIFVKW